MHYSSLLKTFYLIMIVSSLNYNNSIQCAATLAVAPPKKGFFSASADIEIGVRAAAALDRAIGAI